MDSIRERAADQFPTVLITLLSIIQALALEFLWDHIHHRPDLYQMGWPAVAGWLQITATFNGLILIWLVYAGMVMRFRWIPTTGDSVLPFFVGLALTTTVLHRDQADARLVARIHRFGELGVVPQLPVEVAGIVSNPTQAMALAKAP